MNMTHSSLGGRAKVEAISNENQSDADLFRESHVVLMNQHGDAVPAVSPTTNMRIPTAVAGYSREPQTIGNTFSLPGLGGDGTQLGHCW